MARLKGINNQAPRVITLPQEVHKHDLRKKMGEESKALHSQALDEGKGGAKFLKVVEESRDPSMLDY